MEIAVEKVRDDIERVIEEYLTQKAEAGIEKEVEEALKLSKSTLKELTEKVSEMEAKAVEHLAEIDSLSNAKEELSAELEEKKEAVASLEAEKEELTERASKAEEELDNIEKAKKLSERMTSLEKLKVARSGESREKQEKLVSEMTDEDFEVYKKDLASLREEFLASVEVEVASKDGDEDQDVNDGVDLPPASVETGSVVVPNVEGEGVGGSLKELGSALSDGLCEMLANSRKKEKADSDM